MPTSTPTVTSMSAIIRVFATPRPAAPHPKRATRQQAAGGRAGTVEHRHL